MKFANFLFLSLLTISQFALAKNLSLHMVSVSKQLMAGDSSGVPISCGVFKSRLETILQRENEFQLLFALKSKKVRLSEIQAMTEVVKRGHIPLPTLEKLIRIDFAFSNPFPDFNWSQFHYRIKTGFVDFAGEAPYYLEGMSIQASENGSVNLTLNLDYFDACIDLNHLLIEMVDSSGKVLTAQVPESQMHLNR